MISDRVTAFFCLLFISLLSMTLAWMATVTDNQVLRLLAIVALTITWWAVHKERKAIERLLDQLQDDEEQPKDG
jgi:hypothetical protein